MSPTGLKSDYGYSSSNDENCQNADFSDNSYPTMNGVGAFETVNTLPPIIMGGFNDDWIDYSFADFTVRPTGDYSSTTDPYSWASNGENYNFNYNYPILGRKRKRAVMPAYFYNTFPDCQDASESPRNLAVPIDYGGQKKLEYFF